MIPPSVLDGETLPVAATVMGTSAAAVFGLAGGVWLQAQSLAAKTKTTAPGRSGRLR